MELKKVKNTKMLNTFFAQLSIITFWYIPQLIVSKFRIVFVKKYLSCLKLEKSFLQYLIIKN